MALSTGFFTTQNQYADIMVLNKFYDNLNSNDKVMLVVGGGTAALTYLYTHDIDPQYTHVVVLGDAGYWNRASHRLGQSLHLLALPHAYNDNFIDPAEHDDKHDISPDDNRSAYLHSQDFQAELKKLEKAVCMKLSNKGIKVLIANLKVQKVERLANGLFNVSILPSFQSFISHKIILATGIGPARKLPKNIQTSLRHSAGNNKAEDMVLDYSDILTSAKDCQDKVVLVYGGGATAAWVIEKAAKNSKQLIWLAKNGFQEATDTGARVARILKQTKQSQVHGAINDVIFQVSPQGEKKLIVKVVTPQEREVKITVDYIVNCIGQDIHELGGLLNILSHELKNELMPYLEKNKSTGTENMLAWSTINDDCVIIGAASATYRNKPNQQLSKSPAQFLPKAAQANVTICDAVASICAFNNFIPVTQDIETGKTELLSLNVNLMNATQLAVYFTACYPDASPSTVNTAVTDLIAERVNTDFGLSKKYLVEFMKMHFGGFSNPNKNIRARL